MHPNNAEVTRIYTRQTDGLIEDRSPLTLGKDTFEVLVEAEAGSVKYNDQSNWKITISAFDITSGDNPDGLNTGNFSQDTQGEFNGFNPAKPNDPDQWPAFHHVFTVTVNKGAVAGHLMRYYAVLVGNNGQLVSSVESPIFILAP